LHIEFWGSALVLGLVWARANSNRLYISVLCASVVLTGANALTVGSMAFLFVSPLGQRMAAVAALLVGLLVTLPIAVLFERFVDQPAIALSRVFGRFVVLKDARQA
jgi:hypothetical protein